MEHRQVQHILRNATSAALFCRLELNRFLTEAVFKSDIEKTAVQQILKIIVQNLMIFRIALALNKTSYFIVYVYGIILFRY